SRDARKRRRDRPALARRGRAACARHAPRTRLARRRDDRGAVDMSARRQTLGPLAAGALPLAFLGVLFLYPVLRLLLTSVEDGSLRSFERAATDALYVGVLLETLKLSLIVAAICLALAYPVAYFLATASRDWAAIGFACLLLPFWTSILVRTYAWTIVLGRNGLVNRLLLELGLT